MIKMEHGFITSQIKTKWGKEKPVRFLSHKISTNFNKTFKNLKGKYLEIYKVSKST